LIKLRTVLIGLSSKIAISSGVLDTWSPSKRFRMATQMTADLTPIIPVKAPNYKLSISIFLTPADLACYIFEFLSLGIVTNGTI